MWLHWKDCIYQSVHNSTDSSNSEQVNSDEFRWSRQHVEQADCDESWNIFHVISMCSTNSFHIWIIEFRLQILECFRIFIIGKALKIVN